MSKKTAMLISEARQWTVGGVERYPSMALSELLKLADVLENMDEQDVSTVSKKKKNVESVDMKGSMDATMDGQVTQRMSPESVRAAALSYAVSCREAIDEPIETIFSRAKAFEAYIVGEES